MPYIKIKDLNLYYEDLGHGQPILFLHSHFSRGILAFGAQIQPFQGKYRCLFPDFRGHGRTLCESLSWNSRQIAEDMIHFLDEMKISSAYLLGYSCGAYVGMYMAAQYPDRIRGLITIGGGTAPVLDGIEDFLPETIMKRKDIQFIEDMKTRHFDAHKGDWETFMEQTLIDWRSHPNLTDEEWNSIKCPVLFINGEHDSFGSCYELQKKCTEARILEVKNSGHRPHFVMEQAKEINTYILDFLDELER